MILLVCAVARELSWLEVPEGFRVLVTGVGPVEAAINTTRALMRDTYTAVVNAGIAGALPGVANVGEAVVVRDEFMELDVETGEPIVLPDRMRVPDTARSDRNLVTAVTRLGFKAARGVTVSRVTASDATGHRLSALGAQVESMEGFSVLRAAELLGIPAIEVRGISNIVGNRERSRWSFSSGIEGLKPILTATIDALRPTE
ncbi:MAG: futalosine hydrolase [bacterium]|nr:futalosine hydrolase [bacterium]